MRAISKDERNWALFCHLAGLAGYVIPFGNIFGPLLIWLLKKDQSPYIDYHGKEALNFQISFTLYLIVCVIAVFLLVGIVLLPIVAVIGLILIVIAAVKANEGQYYRYPFTFRLID